MEQNLVIGSDNNSPLVPVISLSLFAVASGFLMSLIPLALEARDMSLTLAPWLASIFYAGLLGGSLISAWIVAKIGHRPALISFLFIIVLTIALMMFFASPSIWLGARFVAGVAVAGVFVAIESWLLMAETEKAKAKRLGLYMTSLYGGSALGQLGISLFGTDTALPLMIIISLITLAMLPPIFLRTGQPKKIAHTAIKLNEIKTLPSASYIGCIVSGLVLGAIYGLLPIELKTRYSHDQVGSLMAVVILGGMLVQPLVSWLNSRIEKALLMGLFSLLGILSIAMIEIATVTAGMMTGLFLLGASAFALYPIAITLACRNLTKSKIIAAAELMLLSYSIGSVIGPIVAGASMTIKSGLMLYLSICFAATLVYMLLSSRRHRRRVEQSMTTQTPIDL